MNEYIELVFNTANGSRRSIRVNDPDVDVTPTQVNNAASAIIDRNIFAGGLVSLNRAEIVTVTRTEII